MDLIVLQIFSAFVLFAVILPLVGVALGFFLYYVLPYLFGALSLLVLAVFAGANIILSWWLWLIAFAWASSVYFIRKKLRDLGHDVEHYHAANMLLLGGIPYHRRKKQSPALCVE